MDKQIEDILNQITPKSKQDDCRAIYNMLSEITQESPRIWGKQMIGFGTYTYKRSDGKVVEWFMTGFAPRSKNISIYLLAGFEGTLKIYLDQLGKYTIGKSCLYIKQLKDVDEKVLVKMIHESNKQLISKYKA